MQDSSSFRRHVGACRYYREDWNVPDALYRCYCLLDTPPVTAEEQAPCMGAAGRRRRLTAYSSSQQTAASHAADACAAMSCAASSRPAALWGSTRSRSGTSTCDSSQSISAIRSAVIRTLPGLLGLPWTTHV